jgi:hypothetical protein
LGFDPPDDACPQRACPPFSEYPLTPGNYLLRWSNGENDSSKESQILVESGQVTLERFSQDIPDIL